MRVALMVKQNVASDPIDVGLFGANGVVLESDSVSHAVEQFLLGHGILLFRCCILGHDGV